MQDRKKMTYFCFLIISEYSEFQNYLQNKKLIKTEVNFFPILN